MNQTQRLSALGWTDIVCSIHGRGHSFDDIEDDFEGNGETIFLAIVDKRLKIHTIQVFHDYSAFAFDGGQVLYTNDISVVE